MKQRKSSDSRSRVLFYAAALTVFSFLSPLTMKAENAPHVNVVQQTGLKGSGVGLDPNGDPVVSATVREIGTSNGVITDLEGRFILTVKQGAKLQVSSIGYTSKVVNAKGQLTITLDDDAAQLGEVVAIGYGKAKKGDLSAAVASVADVDKLQKRPVSSVSQMLQGQIPGVSVVANGGHHGRNLVAAFQSVELVGALPCKTNVPVSPIHISVNHQQVSQFPQGALVHNGVFHIAQCRLRHPITRLHRVALQTIVQITVEGHNGILVGTLFHPLQALVVIGECTFGILSCKAL